MNSFQTNCLITDLPHKVVIPMFINDKKDLQKVRNWRLLRNNITVKLEDKKPYKVMIYQRSGSTHLSKKQKCCQDVLLLVQFIRNSIRHKWRALSSCQSNLSFSSAYLASPLNLPHYYFSILVKFSSIFLLLSIC